MGNWLYGCDVCQDVCPWNRKAGRDRSRSRTTRSWSGSTRSSCSASTRTRSAMRFKKTSLWRNRRAGLLRNAAIVLGNVGDERALPALEQALDGRGGGGPRRRGVGDRADSPSADPQRPFRRVPSANVESARKPTRRSDRRTTSTIADTALRPRRYSFCAVTRTGCDPRSRVDQPVSGSGVVVRRHQPLGVLVLRIRADDLDHEIRASRPPRSPRPGFRPGHDLDPSGPKRLVRDEHRVRVRSRARHPVVREQHPVGEEQARRLLESGGTSVA